MSNRSEYKREFDEESYGEMVDSLNTVLDNGLLISSAFGGQIIENIKLPIGVNVAISHNLKITPKYRIILRQTGGLVITDGDLEWDDKKIYLKAVGASGGGGSFVGNIYMNEIFHTSGTFPCSTSGTYTGNPSSPIQMMVSASCLNAAFSSSGIPSDTEATVTIILMRG